MKPTDDDAKLPPPLLDITALAALLGVEPRHIRRLVAERRIPIIKWGHLIRFDPLEIKRWIDRYRRPPGEPA
jgi:excisionase family DNA binding protein